MIVVFDVAKSREFHGEKVDRVDRVNTVDKYATPVYCVYLVYLVYCIYLFYPNESMINAYSNATSRK